VKILFITLPAPDHLTDQLYTGLHTVLGVHNVIDFPYKPACHDPGSKVWFLPQVQAPHVNLEEVLELLKKREFDFVCFAARQLAFDTLATLWRIGVPLPPLILLDGEEDAKIRHEILSQYPISLYFKRDYIWGTRNRALDFLHAAKSFRWNRRLFSRTHPLPLGVALATIPQIENKEKSIDISYTGRASHQCRAKAIQLLKNAKRVKFDGGLYRDPGDKIYKLKDGWATRVKDKHFPHKAQPPDYEVSKLQPQTDSDGRNPYFDQIFRSKIALSIRGGGLTQPIRYYEIVACRTLLLSDIPYAIIPNNFVHKTQAVFYKRDFSDLVQLAEYYANHDAERQAIINAGYKHLLKYHTCERRAQYVLDICQKTL